MRYNYRLLNLPFPSNAVYLRGFFLYAAGVIPSLFLNCFSKYVPYLKPQLSAISATFRLVLDRSSCAIFNL